MNSMIDERSGMSVLRLEQAIYGSQRSALSRGYHVLAKSPGVSSEAVTQLNRWCPSHGSLLGEAHDSWSLNFHPVGRNRFALSRTVYGGPEFSNRGGLQVMTMVLILDERHLSHYDNNPFAVARVARSWGLLRWRPRFPQSLQPAKLPCATISEATPRTLRDRHGAVTAMKAVLAGGFVALTSCHVSIDMLESLLLQVRPEHRLQLSFTTGLKPSPQRPFRLHLVDKAMSAKLRLASQYVTVGIGEIP
jgi:hypothetical protein